MSTILDALSRAERERRIGTAPPIVDALHSPEHQPVARQSGLTPTQWLLAGVLLLLLVAGAWWWIASGSQAHSPTEKSQGASNNVPVKDAGQGGSQPALAAAAPAASVPPASPQPPAVVIPPVAANLPPAVVPPAVVPPAVVPRAVVPPAPAAVAPRAPAQPSTANPALRNPAPARQQETSKTAPGKVVPASKPAANQDDGRAAKPGNAAGLPTYAELPESVRRQLPELGISGYIYAAAPQDRSIILNGRLLKEGDEVAAGLKLEQMRPDGVVLDYKGLRFRKAYRS